MAPPLKVLVVYDILFLFCNSFPLGCFFVAGADKTSLADSMNPGRPKGPRPEDIIEERNGEGNGALVFLLIDLG